MKCELCGKDPRVIVILPRRQANGKLDTLACEACAKKSGAYCKKHDRPHVGFMDGTTACIYCIEELVKANESKAVGIYSRLRDGLSSDQLEYLGDAAETSSEVMRCSASVAVLRFIASKALRTNQTIDEVIFQVTESGRYSVDYILWA